MREVRNAGLRCLIVFAALLTIHVNPASAQLNGHNFTGDFGVQSGSQPAPGVYLALPFFRYDPDTIKDRSAVRMPASTRCSARQR